MKILSKLFGDANEKVVRGLQPKVDAINSLEEKYKAMSDEELSGLTAVFKDRLGSVDGSNKDELKKRLDGLLPDAFAAVRETSRRVLGKRHYDVQLIGGMVLHNGQIAEMKTGEGKTLVATLPLYLNALTGRGAQLITVNDYLSRLGAGWMAPVFHFLGMRTGVIVHDSAFEYDPGYSDDSQFDDRLKNFKPVSRKEAYLCDIVYGTNNEFGFDYLRDNMVPDPDRMVQRELHYAIVDEIDSILIDEARTPLIISAPAEESADKYFKFAQLVMKLKENEDYNVDEKMRAATLSEAGISKMEKMLGVENIYTSGGIRDVHHIEQALKAHALFKKDKDYVVKDGEVIIVDEFTGRMMHGRRYSEGLHQAIEAKEGVKVQKESQTLATITFQNYFRMYEKLSGMTGTAATEAEEFSKIYGLDTIIIPTNKENVRKDLNDLIYRSEEGKYKAAIKDIKERSEKGQPVLVGTISIEKNEILGRMMEKSGIKTQLLNAKNHAKEAQIIADAGKPGAVTLATNMAGRGVDIMLGGNQPPKDSSEYEEWKKRHDKVVSLGGLHVIGTERHESRRIDNQLRGRAGRQGDPGSSQFFVSAEDDLMRIFGGDRMKNIMSALKVPEDMPIENKMISRSIESAQKKVEGHNFDIRKHLVEYDDVINKHREAIYGKRKAILVLSGREDNEGTEENQEKSNVQDASLRQGNGGQAIPNKNNFKSLSEMALFMVESEIEQVVSFHTAAERISDWNVEEIYQVVSTIFPVNEKLKDMLDEYKNENGKLDKVKARTKIIEHLVEMARKEYELMKKGAEEIGIKWREVEKAVLIRSIDTLWVEHLEAMSSVRQGIGLRGYGQRDPLIEYKKEAYRLFNELNSLIQKEVVYSIYKIGAGQREQAAAFTAPSLADRARQFSAPAKTAGSSSSFSGFTPASGGISSSMDRVSSKGDYADNIKQKPKDEQGNKVGRNDPCPCGSGKKYKKCHGR
jgi:preprotein translocase subunit SecA